MVLSFRFGGQRTPSTASGPSIGPDARLRLPALFDVLNRARLRRRSAMFLKAILWSLLTALVVAACGEMIGLAVYYAGAPVDSLSRLAPSWVPSAFSPVMALTGMVAIAAFLVTLIGFGTAAFLSAPGLLPLSRAADRKFALNELLSTAVEQAARPARGTAFSDLLRTALFADAERATARIDIRELAPMRLSRATWAVPLLLIAVLGLGYANLQLLQRPPEARRAAAAPASPLSPQERTEAAATLHAVADLMQKDAATARTPYLEALARTIDRLGTDTNNSNVQRDDLTNTLDDLLAQSDRAYADDQNDAARGEVADALKAELNALRQSRPVTDAQRSPPAPGAKTANPGPPGQSPPVPAGASNGPPPSGQAARITANPNNSPPPAVEGPGYTDVDPQLEREAALERQQEAANRNSGAGPADTPAGGAKDAGKGGNLPGVGVRPLDGDPAENKVDDAAGHDTEQVMLPQEDLSGGQRIRITITPSTQQSAVADSAAAPAAGWSPGAEQPVTRRTPRADGREILQRYFSQSTAEP